MKKPTIKTARWFAERIEARGAILLALDDDGQLVGASWGKTRSECTVMGAALDRLMDGLENPEQVEPKADPFTPSGDFIEDARAVLALLDDLPERAEDFAEGVRERIEGMIEWSEDNDGFATDRMTDALSNMERGIERWQRWAVAVWLLPGAAS